MSEQFSISLSPSASSFLIKITIWLLQSVGCNPTSNAVEESDDGEGTWYEKWDYFHLGYSDIDLHY